MKKGIKSYVIPALVLSLSIGLTGCGSSKTDDSRTGNNGTEAEDTAESAGGSTDSTINDLEGLPKGFPNNIPIYKGAKLIDSDNFNTNGYCILYSVDDDYKDVADFYVDAFALDSVEVGETESYFEEIYVGDVEIKGLTIEDTGEGTNVYITFMDYGQNSEEEETDYTEDSSSSDNLTYDTVEEVALDSGYPEDIVPIYPDAKVIDCSIVPGTSSGFADLSLPTGTFDDAAAYYTDKLGLTPNLGNNSIMKSAEFKGEIEGYKVSVFISQLLKTGSDPFVQITVNEK